MSTPKRTATPAARFTMSLKAKAKRSSTARNFPGARATSSLLPPWSLHEHANSSATDDAVLFSIQDAPVLNALGLFYEEEFRENGGHQKVTSAFTPA